MFASEFMEECPFAVLTHAAIRVTLTDELDEVFHSVRSRQYEQNVAFSDIAFTVADGVRSGHSTGNGGKSQYFC